MKKMTALLLAILMLLSLVPAMAEETDAPSVALLVAGTLGDRGFYDSSNEGLQRLEADGLASKTTVIPSNEDAFRYLQDIFNAAESYDIVVAVGWQYGLYLQEAVPEFPDTKFIFIDNEYEHRSEDDKDENILSIVYKQNEGSFLVGYLAAKMTKTGKIGVVGGEDADTINDFIVGYEDGAKYANPDVDVRVIYANGYEDPANGKDCATSLYNLGCDIVFAVAGKTGEGVFEAAKETGNYAIGVDSDQKYIDPEHIICSMIKSVDKSFYDVIANMDTMFLGGETWAADMANGYIDVGYGTEEMTQQVSDELKTEVEELKQKILDGEIEVRTTLN